MLVETTVPLTAFLATRLFEIIIVDTVYMSVYSVYIAYIHYGRLRGTPWIRHSL